MAFLRLFGYPSLELEEHGSTPTRATQRHRMALLALLATSRGGWSRDKLIGLLWPESPIERARNSLSESLYVLRRTLGEQAIVSSGDELRLGPEARSDVREFEAAITANDLATAVGLYTAPFLDGFFVSRAPDFEHWAEGERLRLRSLYGSALEKLAAAAARNDDTIECIDWWRKRASLDPQDGRVAIALMEALVAGGDRAGALSHARIHTTVLREEFGVEPDRRLVDLERSLRSHPEPVGFETPVSVARVVDPPSSSLMPMQAAPAAPVTLPSPTRTSPRIRRVMVALVVIVVFTAVGRSLFSSRSSTEATPSAASRGTRLTNQNAYALYSRGHEQLASHREPDTRAAIASFEAAISRDTSFALAHAGLAIAAAEMHLRFASAAEAPRWGEVAVREARRALQLDSSLADVHEALAAVHRKSEFDWDGTIRESRHALRLNPKAPMPHFYIAGALYHLGMLAEADRAVRAGLEISSVPDRAEALRTLGTVTLADGRYAEAVSLFQAVQRLSDRPVSDPNLAAAYYYGGDTTRAIQLLETLVTSNSASAASRARAFLASILAARGERARAQALIDQSTAGQVDHHVAYSLGVANARLGRPSDAVRWLRVAWETGFRCYAWYERDPLLAPLRGQVEFKALLVELRIQHAQDARRYAGVA